MTDLVPYAPPQAGGWVALMAPAAELARQITATEFVPASLRNKPAAVTACILFGAELGIGPMQALAKIDVIDGRPAPKAELARALVLAAGHEMWLEDSSNTKCTVAGRRKGSDVVQRITWTMDDAKRAGLDGKQNWRKWPRQMLVARASAELARAAFADCLGGISSFVEELEDETTAPAGPVEAPIAAAPKGRTRRLSPVTPAIEPVDELPPLPDELDTPDTEPELLATEPITDAQTRKLMALFGSLHVTERDDRLALCQSITGRTLTTSKDLSKAEASMVIERLTAVEAGTADIILDDGIPTILDHTPELAS